LNAVYFAGTNINLETNIVRGGKMTQTAPCVMKKMYNNI
jgi:hypothetical protein